MDPLKKPMEYSVGKVQKRNRLSFVCLECRRRKIKCDKQRPCCIQCTEQGLTCVYDIERQPAPRKSSKVSETIELLQRELEYWKLKAQGAGSCETEAETEAVSCPLGSGSIPDPKTNNSAASTETVRNDGEMMVNLNNIQETIVMHEQMKCLHKPFSIMATLQRDSYLRALCGSIYGFTFTDLHEESLRDDTISSENRGEGLGAADKAQKAPKEIPIQAFLENVLQRRVQNKTRVNSKCGPLILFDNCYNLEDILGSEFPSLLKPLIHEIELALPSVQAVKFYLKHFYRSIYAFYPFMDIPSFEKTIWSILIEDQQSARYKLEFKNDDNRRKLENLAILLVVLKMSSMSLSLKTDPYLADTATVLRIFDENKMHTEVLVLVQKCLCVLNVLKFANENCLCCLLYLRACEYLAPDDENVLLPQQSLLMLGSISQLALILGLYKDPSTYSQLVDPSKFGKSLLNYRRKLWLSMISANVNELLPNGCDESTMSNLMNNFLKRSDHNLDYLTTVIKDMDEENHFDISTHELLLKEYQVAAVLTELNTICSPANGAISLSKIETLLSKGEEVLKLDFPLSRLQKEANSNNFVTLPCFEQGTKIDFGEVYNAKNFTNNILGRLVLLNVTSALSIYFENLNSDNPFKYLAFYQKFLLKSCKYCFELVKLLKKLLSGELDQSVPLHLRYSVNKTVQLALTRVMVSLTSIILRSLYSESKLLQEIDSKSFLYNDTSHSSISRKLESIIQLRINLCDVLQMLVDLSSKKLSHEYFGCYKVTCLFKYLLHFIEAGKLVEATNKFWDYKLSGREIPPSVSNRVLFKWGINVEDSKFIKEKLYNMQTFGALETSVFQRIQSTLDALSLIDTSKRDQNSNLTNILDGSNPITSANQNVSSSVPSGQETIFESFDADILKYFSLVEGDWSTSGFPNYY